MSVRKRTVLLTTLLISFVATGALSAREMPRPLVELLFTSDMKNTGTLGGEGPLEEYAPGEGGTLGPGLRGRGLDLTASSRGGGSERTKAGGSVKLDGKGIEDKPKMSLKERARRMPARPPLFDHGDVCLSSRSIRPQSIETIKAFRANRLMWAYSTDADFIQQCKEAGAATCQGAINSLPGHSNTEAHCLDLEAFDYRRYLAEQQGIHDANTYKGKRRSLPLTRHFEDFQRRSVRKFFTALRKRIDARAGRTVPMSINSTFLRPDQPTNFVADIADFLQGETWSFDLASLTIACKAAEGLGKWQLFVPKPKDARQMRTGIAAVYAMGQLMLVPWDMYMGSDATGIQPRYYGTCPGRRLWRSSSKCSQAARESSFHACRCGVLWNCGSSEDQGYDTA
ncbi:MAG: hypothetical protein ACC645_15545 [Pirellulales bacterium]